MTGNRFRWLSGALAGVAACVVTALPGWCQDTLTPGIRTELRTATVQLGEIMRQDVEVITVPADQIVPLPLVNTTPGGQRYRSRGALVPFQIMGQGGGNFEGEYVALFILIDPDWQRLRNFGRARNLHPYVGLLAFTQIDNRAPLVPRWKEAVAAEGRVTVPVDVHDCGGRHGVMTIHADDDDVGPRLRLEFDPGAALGPDACIRRP
jgi:hypothetical protein